MLGQDGVDDLGEHGVFVADDTLEERGAGLERLEEVGPEFLADGAARGEPRSRDCS